MEIKEIKGKPSLYPNAVNLTKKILCTAMIIIASISICYYTDYLYGIRALDLITGYSPLRLWHGTYNKWNGQEKRGLKGEWHYEPSEYINISKHKFAEFKTKNGERKKYTNKSYKYYADERIAVYGSNTLGSDTLKHKWLNTDIGVLPAGKIISSYEKDSMIQEDHYYYGFYYDRHYEKIRYNCYQCFSTFDISDKILEYDDESKAYNTILDSIKDKLQRVYNISVTEDTVDGCRAISYCVRDVIPLKRVIFCANERTYMLETKSTKKMDELSDSFCKKLEVKTYEKRFEWKYKVVYPYCIMIFCIMTVLLLNIGRISNKTCKNIQARNIALFNMTLLIASIVTLYFFIAEENTSSAYMANPGISSLLSISILLNTITIAWISDKGKSEFKVDYLIPNFLRKNVYAKIKKDINKRLFLSFVIYPVVVLIATPLCGYIIMYGVLMALLVALAQYFAKWKEWLKAGSDNGK